MLSPVRPWYRLHAVTWIVGAVVAMALVLQNVCAFQFAIHGWHLYGWPSTFAQHPVAYENYSEKSRWLGVEQINGFFPKSLAIDLAACLGIFVGAGIAVERLCRRGTIKPRASLKGMLA